MSCLHVFKHFLDNLLCTMWIVYEIWNCINWFLSVVSHCKIRNRSYTWWAACVIWRNCAQGMVHGLWHSLAERWLCEESASMLNSRVAFVATFSAMNCFKCAPFAIALFQNISKELLTIDSTLNSVYYYALPRLKSWVYLSYERSTAISVRACLTSECPACFWLLLCHITHAWTQMQVKTRIIAIRTVRMCIFNPSCSRPNT